MTRPTSTASGFTLIEVTVTLALALPLLLVLATASRAVIDSFTATDRTANTTEVVLRSLRQVERALQSGQRGSLRTPATRDDVRQGRAAAVGDWMALPVGEPRTHIEVTSLLGDPCPPLRIPTRLHRLSFVRDAAELVDGRDNDGDSLVDEGAIHFVSGDERFVLCDRIEACTFEFTGRAIRVAFRHARAGSGGRVQRVELRHTVNLHNP